MSSTRLVRGSAPAKINRELRVGPVGADRFHPILSRFASIDLVDTLEAELADDVTLTCDDPRLPVDASNLVVKAARALADRFRCTRGARLTLKKGIPIGAGLGGGSSDAALAVRLLSKLWTVAAADADLQDLASSLGSDVPFFLVGGEADVSGRGERVLPREDGPGTPLAILVPPFGLRTAEVYGAFDGLASPTRLPERLEIERSGRFLGPNDLEPAARAVQPEMARYLTSARSASTECSMTGSGSAIVMTGTTPESLSRLAAALPEAAVRSCRTLARREHLALQGVRSA